ncbi:MAG: hypothetical protein SOW34_18620 [Oliverpabstia sp.]|nr:hypothetical protein [Oliverpabstia sp.]
MAVMAFLLVRIGEMFMAVIFMSFIRKREWFGRKEAEIVRNYDRKALAAGKRCISMGEKDKSAGYGT